MALGIPRMPQLDTSKYEREVRYVMSDGMRRRTAPLSERERRFWRWQIADGNDNKRSSRVRYSSFCSISSPENPASLDDTRVSLLSCTGRSCLVPKCHWRGAPAHVHTRGYQAQTSSLLQPCSAVEGACGVKPICHATAPQCIYSVP